MQSARSQRPVQSTSSFSTALTTQGLGSRGVPVRTMGGVASLVATAIPSRPTNGQQNGGGDNNLAVLPVAEAPLPAKSQDAISLLSANLRQRGFDPASFGFTYSEQPVSYPGGSYTNHLITAHINGQTENYDANLVMKNPEVAAVEMLRLMGHRA